MNSVHKSFTFSRFSYKTNPGFWIMLLVLLKFPLSAQNNNPSNIYGGEPIEIRQAPYQVSIELNASQESFLESLAEHSSSVRDYARGLLGILADRRFYPEELNLEEERQMSIGPALIHQPSELAAFPNHATSEIIVTWPSKEINTHLEVFDLFGNLRTTLLISPFENQFIINTMQLPVGVYFIVVSDRGKPNHRVKFLVQH